MTPNIPYNAQVKDYIQETLTREDEVLQFIRLHALEMGLPDIQVPPQLGQLIYLLAKVQGPRQILEVGTLAGYSTVCLARALRPQGKLLSLEINAQNAAIAREHIAKAGLSASVEVREGNACELLPRMVEEGREGPFDVIFLDADKKHNKLYLDCAIQLARTGSLILIDNLIPKGDVVGRPCNHEAVDVYDFNQYFVDHPRLETSFITTIVGQQGRLDSLGIARLK